MKIAIIGGGAIGLLYSYYLNQFHHVVLYVRNRSQIESISSKGLQLKNKDGLHTTTLDIKHISEWGNGEEDLSIICVKQYHLPELFQKEISTAHPLLFLQNGMGHLKWIDKLQLENALVGTVEHGALRENENSVVHTGEGLTKIASYKGELTKLVTSLTKPCEQFFPFKIEVDYVEMLQRKLIVNAVINPLTAMLKVPNGALLENPYFFQMFQVLFTEVSEILTLKDTEEYFEHVRQVCQKTGKNRSSMLKDLEEGRPTEIDAIVGFLLEEALENKKQAPLLNTLFHFIKGSELEKGEK